MNNQSLVLVDGKTFTSKDMMLAVDGVIVQLNQTGNIQEATKVLNILDSIDNVTGHAKSYLLWGISEWWKINKPDDDFGDYIESVSSTRKITVTRYINVWQQIQDENIPKRIQERSMRDLVPVANMLAQGFEPTKKQWDEIHLASNSSELSNVIRKIKKQKPRKSGMTLQMERDGSINLYKGGGKKYVGFLDVVEAETDEDIAKAIERIISGAQIIRR